MTSLPGGFWVSSATSSLSRVRVSRCAAARSKAVPLCAETLAKLMVRTRARGRILKVKGQRAKGKGEVLGSDQKCIPGPDHLAFDFCPLPFDLAARDRNA